MTNLGDNTGAETLAFQQVSPLEGKPVSNQVEITSGIDLEVIEAKMLSEPQVDCPVTHRFGPNIYIREITMPAGMLAIGHTQKFEHMNVVLCGKVAMIDGDKVKIVEGPSTFVGKPGRKIGYVIETCVWQNVYSTSETDIETLEETYLIKSKTWKEKNAENIKIETAFRNEDRKDFLKVIKSAGFDEKTVRAQSENKSDQITMPCAWAEFISVRKSEIEGKGLFTSWTINAGEVICPARISGFRTPAGRYTNHSKTPNAEFLKLDNDDVFLVALHDINGCKGGGKGDEITVDYRQALMLNGISVKEVEET
jgi:hypothetical protein